MDIPTIAAAMRLSPESCEAFVVQLIQTGRLTGACIEERGSTVSFPKVPLDVSDQVLEKTKNMSFRMYLLTLKYSFADI